MKCKKMLPFVAAFGLSAVTAIITMKKANKKDSLWNENVTGIAGTLFSAIAVVDRIHKALKKMLWGVIFTAVELGIGMLINTFIASKLQKKRV